MFHYKPKCSEKSFENFGLLIKHMTLKRHQIQYQLFYIYIQFKCVTLFLYEVSCFSIKFILFFYLLPVEVKTTADGQNGKGTCKCVTFWKYQCIIHKIITDLF